MPDPTISVTFVPRRSLKCSSGRISELGGVSRTSRDSRSGSQASARFGSRIRRREIGAWSMIASAVVDDPPPRVRAQDDRPAAIPRGGAELRRRPGPGGGSGGTGASDTAGAGGGGGCAGAVGGAASVANGGAGGDGILVDFDGRRPGTAPAAVAPARRAVRAAPAGAASLVGRYGRRRRGRHRQQHFGRTDRHRRRLGRRPRHLDLQVVGRDRRDREDPLPHREGRQHRWGRSADRHPHPATARAAVLIPFRGARAMTPLRSDAGAVRMSDADLEAMLARAAEEGARRAPPTSGSATRTPSSPSPTCARCSSASSSCGAPRCRPRCTSSPLLP